MNKYQELRKKHQQEYDAFPKVFAITKEDLKKGLKKLGLNENDTNKVIGITGRGFIRITDEDKYKEMLLRQYKEHYEQISLDKDGTGYIKEMFITELANHEYGYAGDLEDALMALDLELADIEKNPALKKGLELAKEVFNKEESEIEEEYSK